METYIVRIYRRDKGEPRHVVGLLEHVGTQSQQPFHDAEELVALLRMPSPEPGREGEDRGGPRLSRRRKGGGPKG